MKDENPVKFKDSDVSVLKRYMSIFIMMDYLLSEVIDLRALKT